MAQEFDVIVVGGGPAGATASGLLAKWGWRVLVLEKEKFPRYHIGESLVPGCMPILEDLGVKEAVEATGATRKYGISFLWGADPEPWSVDFDEVCPHPYAFEVKRAEFDSLLLSNSRRLGATVLEEAPVRDFLFEDGRCVGVRYGRDGATEARARFVIDASGQAKLLAREFGTVGWHDDLKNLATWTYFQGGTRLPGRRSGDIVVETLHPGWLWLIPFTDGTCSVGFVAPAEEYKATGLAPEEVLRRRIGESVVTRGLLEGAVEAAQPRTAKDWSYTNERFGGPGFLLTGDAAAFIDPLFSTGVMLAMKGASTAARTVNAILERPGEEEGLRARYETSYRDFLDVVLSFVRFFYDPSREVIEYFEAAKKLVDPDEALAARQDFVMLISGTYGIEPVMEGVPAAPNS
ncbi:NAD(P)/FAD-dependent oxidoreductase [Actinomadura roseirufa]|uniref:NAD(P)/FAD-dependent oxidoreductase n=1 Tax=Actinomadura roseirufa TaxID=2094049 RepID=UPI0010417CDC|nr:NAD(P)/FAD-dependent oxidoreductase [Actinomadura roseirufa]